MSSDTRLTFATLDTLLDRALKYGEPGIAEALAPGLTLDEIEATTRPHGIELPVEAKTLWQWRDGCDLRSRIFVGRQWPSLTQALELRDEQRDIAEDTWEEDADEGWPRSFLPLFDSDGDIYAIDCARPAADLAPIHLMWLDEPRDEAIATPATESIGQLVRWWIEAYETGAVRFDRSDRHWRFDENRQPPERRHLA